MSYHDVILKSIIMMYFWKASLNSVEYMYLFIC